jgi:hypothetical protein
MRAKIILTLFLVVSSLQFASAEDSSPNGTSPATCDGATCDGATCDGATCDGATCDGATCDGATCNGATCNGATEGCSSCNAGCANEACGNCGGCSSCDGCRVNGRRPQGDMHLHYPYQALPRTYYYFRPYNHEHVRQQQGEAQLWGSSIGQPYSNKIFADVYKSFAEKQTAAATP